MRQAAQQIRSATGAARARHASRAITLQRSRHTPCAVAEPPSRITSANQFHTAHSSSNAQRESVTAHGVPAPNGPPAKPGARGRRGVTLLELLVVMLIILMVTAAAIPIIAPAMQNRQMREATRLVTSFMGAAKARAVQTGRPVGVVIERFNGQPFALQMAQVEVPPPYSGDTMQSKMTIGRYQLNGTITGAANNGSGAIRITVATALPFPLDDTLFVSITNVEGTTEANGTWKVIPIPGNDMQFDLENSAFANTYTMGGDFSIPCWPCITGFTTPADSWQNMVRYGDRVRLDYRGVYYTLRSVPQSVSGVDPKLGQPVTAAPPGNDTDGYWFLIDENNEALDFADGYRYGVPYQFYRQPVRTSSPPLQLPEGIVFDLSVSGVGSMRFNQEGYTGDLDATINPPLVRFDPQIIFSPSGRLEWVTSPDDGTLVRPTDPIFLLLGRRDLMFDVTTRGTPQDIVFQNLSPLPAKDATTPPAPAQNFWVTIGYQTGQVTVAEIAPHAQVIEDDPITGPQKMYGITDPNITTQSQAIDQTLNGNLDATSGRTYRGALDFARESQSLGGR